MQPNDRPRDAFQYFIEHQLDMQALFQSYAEDVVSEAMLMYEYMSTEELILLASHTQVLLSRHFPNIARQVLIALLAYDELSEEDDDPGVLSI